MKAAVVLALAGTGAAAPSIITKAGDAGAPRQPTGAVSRRFCINWFQPDCECSFGQVLFCWVTIPIPAEAPEIVDSLDDKVDVGSVLPPTHVAKVDTDASFLPPTHVAKAKMGSILPPTHVAKVDMDASVSPPTHVAKRSFLISWPHVLPRCDWKTLSCLPWKIDGFQWMVHPGHAEAVAGAKSSQDEVEVSISPGTISTTISTETATKTSITTTLETQTRVARAVTVTSTETTSQADPSTTPADSAVDEAESSLDDGLEEFQTSPSYSRIAQEEDTPYPYALVAEDQNKTAIHQPIATHYDEYDADVCAEHCTRNRACDSFAIYVERQPSCDFCSNPETVIVNRCDLYNTRLHVSDIRKEGEEQDVQGKTITRAVRAYNGYNRIQGAAPEPPVRTVTVTVTVEPVTSTVPPTPSSESESTVASTEPTVTVTQTSTESSSANPTIRTVTRTVTTTETSSAPLTTFTRTVMFTTTVSNEPSTVTTTEDRTVVVSSVDTVTSTETSTVTAMFTTTELASPTTAAPSEETVTSTETSTVVVPGEPSEETVTSTETSTETPVVTTTELASPTAVV